jgi:hypothetical protein
VSTRSNAYERESLLPGRKRGEVKLNRLDQAFA